MEDAEPPARASRQSARLRPAAVGHRLRAERRPRERRPVGGASARALGAGGSRPDLRPAPAGSPPPTAARDAPSAARPPQRREVAADAARSPRCRQVRASRDHARDEARGRERGSAASRSRGTPRRTAPARRRRRATAQLARLAQRSSVRRARSRQRGRGPAAAGPARPAAAAGSSQARVSTTPASRRRARVAERVLPLLPWAIRSRGGALCVSAPSGPDRPMETLET